MLKLNRKNILAYAASCALGIAMAVGFFETARAQAAPATSDIATIDAGAVLDAHAAPVDGSKVLVVSIASTPTLPDAAANPLSFAQTVWAQFKAGALIPGLILLCFGAAVLLRKYVGWFTTGKQAAYFAAALAGLTAIATTAAGGSTPTLGQWLAGLTAAAVLLIHPSAAATTTAS